MARLQAASTKPKSGRRTYKKLIARGVSHLLPNERDNCDYCSFVSRNNNNSQLCNDLVNYSERILGSGTGTTRRNTKGRHFYKRNAFPLHFPLFSIILHIISRIVSSKFISTITISNSQPSSKIHNQNQDSTSSLPLEYLRNTVSKIKSPRGRAESPSNRPTEQQVRLFYSSRTILPTIRSTITITMTRGTLANDADAQC